MLSTWRFALRSLLTSTINTGGPWHNEEHLGLPAKSGFRLQVELNKDYHTENQRPEGAGALQKKIHSRLSIFKLSVSLHRKDREDRSGGGLLIAVPSNISAQQIPIQIQQTRELEILAIKIHVRNISFYMVNIYAPRGFNIILIKSFLESLMAPMIIFGDFNLHHPMWGSDHISRYSNEFVEWITDSNLVLNTTVPTYRSSADATSLLDLTVCSSSMSGYCNSYVLDCSFESDHSPIITELSLNSNKRIFKKVNWQAVMNQTHFIFNNPEVDSENLSDKISHVIANNIREIKSLE
ncbi:replication-associated protein [Trichonephila clavipes]|nr:replication-associated protein [Trichonephila clavipes]